MYIPKNAQPASLNIDKQYDDLVADILSYGYYIDNERTGISCITLEGQTTITIDIAEGQSSIISSKKVAVKSAIAEIFGYLKGVTDAQEFADLGTKTWFANANETPAWLKSPYRKGVNDMGNVYGHWLHNWPSSVHGTVNQLEKVYKNLKQGKDDRGEILLMHNPGEIETGCLRACMFMHTFQLLPSGTLNLISTMRSQDVLLGLPFNLVQCDFLLRVMAMITGNLPGKFILNSTNSHIYSNHVGIFNSTQALARRGNNPTFNFKRYYSSLEEFLNDFTLDDIEVCGMEDKPPAPAYPMAV